MADIEFIADGVEMPDLNFPVIREWIESVARSFEKSVGSLTYIFCNDEKIIEVNRQYLQHDYYTDVITFDYTRPKRISGDMFISLDTVLSNSQMLGKSYADELNRVVIHGVLHLCGINDKGEGEREIMEKHEDKALSMLKKIQSNEI